MDEKLKKKIIRIGIALVLFAGLMIFPLPDLYAQSCALLVPYIIAGYDIFIKAIKNLSKKKILDENFLIVIASIGAFLLVFFPGEHSHMAEGVAVVLFFQVGEIFEHYASHRSKDSIKAMMDLMPSVAHVVKGDQLIDVDPEKVSIDDVFVVKKGEKVPIDGVVEKGSTSIDTSALTGESVPRPVAEGDTILSGCINCGDTITMRATKSFENSSLSHIFTLLEQAKDHKAKAERFITQFARYYTPLVTISALIIAFVVPLILQTSFAPWIEKALIFLVVSCPCALVISVPLSFFGGIGGASKKGILIKGGNVIEALAKIKCVAFDKTGTLTKGVFEVQEICSFNNYSKEDILKYAAHVEAFSTHPIALSLQKAYQKNIDMDTISIIKEDAGKGLQAYVGNTKVTVGRASYMQDLKMKVPDLNDQPVATCVYVSIDDAVEGCIYLGDVIKEETPKAIQALKNQGIKTMMLTGDAQSIAASVAQTIGIDEYRAELLPQEKHEIISVLEKNKEEGTIAFVGDGINDAPALVEADCGIAMGGIGSDIAIESADIIVAQDNPKHISTCITLAQKTCAIARENIIFALAVKFAILGLTLFGIANMWLAVFADVGVSCLAIINAMRTMYLAKKIQ